MRKRQAQKSKTIKRFRSMRGRPPKEALQRNLGPDLGTPELIMKRACNETVEAIDLCLKRNLISDEEHRHALHLRWLHTIRYGAPGISALDIARASGKEIAREDDPEWRAQREQDYHSAVNLLHQSGYAHEILPCVLYNERPNFLKLVRYDRCLKHPQEIAPLEHQAARFAYGLSLIGNSWHPRRL